MARCFDADHFPKSLLIIGVIVIVGALNFLPGPAMGPIAEHFLMTGSKILYLMTRSI